MYRNRTHRLVDRAILALVVVVVEEEEEGPIVDIVVDTANNNNNRTLHQLNPAMRLRMLLLDRRTQVNRVPTIAAARHREAVTGFIHMVVNLNR